MPMYLGSDRVKGMYLGSNVYDGFALGSTAASTYDYGVDQYAMPLGTTDEANWTINTGFSAKGSDADGMWFREGTSGGNCESPSITPVVGRKYQYVVHWPTGAGQGIPSLNTYGVGFGVGGTIEASTIESLDEGGTATYTYTATSTSPLSIILYSFAYDVNRILSIDEVYIKEVK